MAIYMYYNQSLKISCYVCISKYCVIKCQFQVQVMLFCFSVPTYWDDMFTGITLSISQVKKKTGSCTHTHKGYCNWSCPSNLSCCPSINTNSQQTGPGCSSKIHTPKKWGNMEHPLLPSLNLIVHSNSFVWPDIHLQTSSVSKLCNLCLNCIAT